MYVCVCVCKCAAALVYKTTSYVVTDGITSPKGFLVHLMTPEECPVM